MIFIIIYTVRRYTPLIINHRIDLCILVAFIITVIIQPDSET